MVNGLVGDNTIRTEDAAGGDSRYAATAGRIADACFLSTGRNLRCLFFRSIRGSQSFLSFADCSRSASAAAARCHRRLRLTRLPIIAACIVVLPVAGRTLTVERIALAASERTRGRIY